METRAPTRKWRIHFRNEVHSSDYTASNESLPQVDWLIRGSKLPGRLLPEHSVEALSVMGS